MISLLDPDNPEEPFPPVEQAEREPDGLLAVGGDLSPTRLLNAYRHGIFPWYSLGQPILWWAPDPRTVLFPKRIKVSRSLAKTLRNRDYRFTFDSAFADVIDACATPQPGREETWITAEMKQAYIRLHQLGHAHSVEIWEQNRLVGGLYGIAIGRVFYGESMFSRVRDASKIALVHLARYLDDKEFGLIDCQVYSAHLISLGAEEIRRQQFCEYLQHFCNQAGLTGSWTETHDKS
ncbi:leucyl/phenylalanyl-tRNA--protein transferase [Sedimenticola thiotaurini]|uniref:Leucyl/phenylalanyl-tRNA--protein transferase n=1 Tax=Sedimenticola thiotaurini TaxID=1543721 RepID=A0A0F7JWQ3_9GAMM|nr:leucyl/phenylalanyl-tRNA--protein transferase [Sedimenticola thiotaurini]AKH19809.1 leucyl/phenylalanyl-tRNA--protein transferase [Sedimenticola thiotaurini]